MFKTFDKAVENLLVSIYSALHKGKFGLKEKIFFFRELAYLLEGGVGIVEAIDIINKNSANFAIKEMTSELYRYLNQGEAFHRALLRLRKYFNDADIAIVRGGEQSGELIKVMKFLANEYEFLFDVRQKYIGALVYPFILILAGIAAIYVIFAIVMPSLLGIIDSFGNVELSWSVKVLKAGTEFMIKYWWLIFVGFLLLIGLFGVIVAFPEGKKWRDKTLLSLPIIGNLQKQYLLVKFMRYFSLFLKAGLNYKEIFKALDGVMNIGVYSELFEESLDAIDKGQSFVDVFEHYSEIIPPDVVVLLRVGERTASIASALDNAIVLYESEFKKVIDNFSKVIEPLLILVIGWIVSIIAFAVFGLIGSILDSLQSF